MHRSGLVSHGLADPTVGQEVSYLVTTMNDGRKMATDVRDRHGKAVDDAVLRRQKLDEARAAQDRVVLHHATDTFTGRKNHNEDRASQGEDELDFGKWFGVYDGHGGVEASDHVAANLYRNILDCWKNAGRPQGLQRLEALAKTVTDGFARTEAAFIQIAARKKLHAGSTAICVLVHGREPPKPPGPLGHSSSAADAGALTLMTANLGDSRAVLCRDGLALALSEDHKPDRKDEKARVEQAGGVVVNIGGIWRVCTAASSTGIKLHYDDNLYLATSRAFGDRLLKGDHGDLVSSVPEIKCQSVEPNDLFFVLACDGVWDVMSDQDVVDVAAKALVTDNAREAAAAVVREAYKKASLDNLTATVVQFDWQSKERILHVMAAAKAKLQREAEAKKKKEAAIDDDIDMFA